MNAQDSIELGPLLNRAYEVIDGSEVAEQYCDRHGVGSLAVLTVYDDERASALAEFLSERVAGKTVVEIGGGIGLLAMHLAEYAKRVWVIEANPFWSHIYVKFLHLRKPKNVTFIFGAADELAGQLTADVAIFCTHSDANGMRKAGALFAPDVIDVYADLLGGKTVTDRRILRWMAHRLRDRNGGGS